jgi:hypothetical protein
MQEPLPDPAPDPRLSGQLAEELTLALQTLRPVYREAILLFHVH